MRLEHMNAMETVQVRKAGKPAFEALWKRIEEVRNDPEAMKLLDKLIKVHTS